MAFAYDKLMGYRLETTATYTVRDTILYALGVGAGIDAAAPYELRYVYEDGLLAIPSMAVILGAPGFWLRNPDLNIDWENALHGDQSFVIHNPIPVEGSIRSVLTVDKIYDKGAGKGAVLYSTRVLHDAKSEVPLATLKQGIFLRGDGGAGGTGDPSPRPYRLPDRTPSTVITLPTRSEQALIYRLSGDLNPLHVDHAAATRAGFERPILHGLATYGVVCRALISTLCKHRSERLNSMDARFSSPVYPGESITIEIWKESETTASFRALVAERDVVVVNNGFAEFDAEQN